MLILNPSSLMYLKLCCCLFTFLTVLLHHWAAFYSPDRHLWLCGYRQKYIWSEPNTVNITLVFFQCQNWKADKWEPIKLYSSNAQWLGLIEHGNLAALIDKDPLKLYLCVLAAFLTVFQIEVWTVLHLHSNHHVTQGPQWWKCLILCVPLSSVQATSFHPWTLTTNSAPCPGQIEMPLWNVLVPDDRLWWLRIPLCLSYPFPSSMIYTAVCMY